MVRQPRSSKTIWAIARRRPTRTDVMPPSGLGGAIVRTGEGTGLRPETPPRGAAPWIPAKGSGPSNPLVGLFSGEGLHGPCKVVVGPPLRTNPIDRFQRASPFGGVQGQSPWRVSGRSPDLRPVRAIASP